MNENYLLHNETAKKLYFGYASHLPILSLSSKLELSEKPYNNIAEAFLLNDNDKLLLMQRCGIDDKYINGDASDYEKFKSFCSALSYCVGSPIYILSHMELWDLYGCKLEINEKNCDEIWRLSNAKIIGEALNDKKLTELAGIEHIPVISVDWKEELSQCNQISDLEDFETVLTDKVCKAHEKGCRASLKLSYTDYIKPSPYKVNKIIKKIRDGKSIDDIYADEYDLLNMQAERILGIEYKRLGWVSFIVKEGIAEESKNYLIKSNAFPNTVEMVDFYLNDIEETINSYALENPLGKLVYYLNSADDRVPYAKHDYFRRSLCNYIGKCVEYGEYSDDISVLKDLINNILYSNIKKVL